MESQTTEFTMQSVIFIQDVVAQSELNLSIKKYLLSLCSAWMAIEGINEEEKEVISQLLRGHLELHLKRCTQTRF